MISKITITVRIKTIALTNIEILEPKESYTTWISAFKRLTNKINQKLARLKIEKLTKVSSASFIKESDVLIDHILVEVFPKISGYSLTQNVENGSSHTDANTRYLSTGDSNTLSYLLQYINNGHKIGFEIIYLR